ncbi:MAG: DNA replication/repair protein RecF [Armatimonadota bacterium]|nr:DNA replication/repair protein RecF [bacterium]MDW8320457.1 DNA replication/repair protein RecF [Armatimonadota bacterium]
MTELSLCNFRNYERLHLEPDAGLNLITGENAQGKTNLLEAIYLLATGRALRAGKDDELIRWNAEEATVQAHIYREQSLDVRVQVILSRAQPRVVKVDGQTYRAATALGQFNVVVFSAIDLEVVRGQPADRRRYLDVEISMLSPAYARALMGYRRALEQRNRLLKGIREGGGTVTPSIIDLLEAWDEQLVRYGSGVIVARERFICALRPLACAAHAELSEGREQLDIRYAPAIEEAQGEREQVAERFRQQLRKMREEEIRRGTTLAGPQRDDLLLLVDGKEARTYASQGQQRTVMLSLKQAEFELTLQERQEPPVVLLDDVMSDLDDLRRSQLLRMTLRGAQAFITATSAEAFPRQILAVARTYRVQNGRLEVVQ